MRCKSMMIVIIILMVLVTIVILTKMVLDYLDKHPDTVLTVSGKIGPGEFALSSKPHH